MIRLIGYFFGVAVMLALLAAGGVALYIGHVTKELPDYEVLARYEPPVTTRVHASDGALMAEFARERRLFIPIQAVPDRVKAAFLSAEDKNFYTHPGIDLTGLARAIVVNVQNYGSRRPVGASTITQQVAKNFLLSADQTIDRKIKEAVLAFRIEQAYSKDRILELYLNEIFFGMGAYGVAGAALTYFDKSVSELSVAEAAYLASLPKGPSNYHPFKYHDRAIERRNWVIDQMVENGYVTPDEGAKAKAEDLGVKPRRSGTYLAASEYFTEEVRRELVARYGQNALYEGGLSVRTTLDPTLQLQARKAMQHGLVRYDMAHGYRGPVKTIDASGDWGKAIGEVAALSDVPEWRLAVVLEATKSGISIGLQPKRDISGAQVAERETGTINAEDVSWALRHTVDGKMVKAKSVADVLKAGDVVYVEAKDGSPTSFNLRQPPAVSGGLIAMDPHTGRVLAMVGGFSFAQSEFNRATQALRQPGSSFKPFIYSAALDNGYTPASVVMDGPITIHVGNDAWTPKNYGGGYGGPSTLRTGIERSRNLMTVRLANDMGMPLVAEYAERFGVYDKMPQHIALSLGAGETTVMRMVSAYSVMANGGKSIKPSLIDRIQDRYGKTVYRHDERKCDNCNAQEWDNQAEPELVDNAEQVLDPMTAYQITSMMEGVVLRGTATSLRDLNRPIAGKTGTSNDSRDTWFVGYTPNLVIGLYMGYDKPSTLGAKATGGSLAVPIFKEAMTAAMKDKPVIDFHVPEGMKLIAIDRKTGMQAQEGQQGTIIEAFKPGTGPADSYSVIGMDDSPVSTDISPAASQAITSGGGGLY